MGFQRKGRNPTGNELPNVGEGSPIRPSHINQVAAAADRASIKSGKGYRFSQTSGGTSLKITNPNDPSPWAVFPVGTSLCMHAGNVWGKGVGKKPLHTTGEWGAVKPDRSKTFWTARPVMIGVSGANLVATDEINDARAETSSNIISMPLLTGYYYIEYAKWTGRTDKSPSGIANTLKDTKQFILKHKTDLEATDNVVVVCYVSNTQQVYQSVKGDIWWGLVSDDDGHPFKIVIRKVEQSYKAFLIYGTVNNQYVEYGSGGYVGDDDVTGISVPSGGGSIQIVLELSYEEGNSFPVPDPIVYSANIERAFVNTNQKAYVHIGEIIVTTGGNPPVPSFKINQAVSGSLWVERFKCGSGDEPVAIYWVTKI